jgi:hypothetical protein
MPPRQATGNYNISYSNNRKHINNHELLTDPLQPISSTEQLLQLTDTKNGSMPSYYDIDTILAEEELIQIRPSFPFSHLSHLDPESSSRKRRRVDKENIGNSRSAGGLSHVLEEGTKIKMPLWAVDRWVVLGFVRVTLPGIYGTKMKERLLADPVSVDLG